jgi:membrane dipeptidase
MKKLLVLCLCLLLFCFVFAGSQETTIGEKALEHVTYLASDSLQGRYSGLPGYQKACEYVAARMKEIGLKPAQENGSYFQNVTLKNWSSFFRPARLEIQSPRPQQFVPGRGMDFSPVRGTGSGIARGELAFAGYGLRADEYGWDDYSDLDVKDRIIVLMPEAPVFMKKLAAKKKTSAEKIRTAIRMGAKGVIFIASGRQTRRRRDPGLSKGLCPENFVVVTAEDRVIDRLFELGGVSWRNLVSLSIREKKSHTSLLDVGVEMEAHYLNEDRTAPNVIGIIPGTHPEKKGEYIIIGGHLDHLGVALDGAVYNGADDNAASVAVMLEAARVLLRSGFQPDRTLVFCAWAGEEQGLRGSRWYCDHPLFPLKKTALYINMDMIGQGDDDLFVGGMWEFEDLYNLIKPNIRPEFYEKLKYRLDYRGSDHSSFLNKNVSSISLRTGNPLTPERDDEHPEYHRQGDEISTIRPELLTLATEYNLDVLRFLANCPNNLLIPKHHIYFLHKTSRIADMHCDTISRFLEGEDLTKDGDSGHIDIPKLKQGAVDLQVFACYVGPPRDELEKYQAAKKVFDQIDAVHQLVEENKEDLHLVLSYQDTNGTRGTRKTAVLIGIEGGYAIEDDIRLLRSFYRSGARLMTLTHWLDTGWADASGDPDANLGGLTEFGREVVEEMNRLGMVIDVSHAHDETFWDVIESSKHPIIASHSCCRALSDHHRNLSDKMLKALKKNGGVIGINYAPGFLNAENGALLDALRSEILKKYGLPEDWRALSESDPDTVTKFQEEYEEKAAELRLSLPPVDVRTVVDHIDHVVKVTGNTSHVGLGSDFDGIGRPPQGLEHIGLVSNITAELIRRGYKDSDIKKILGGNFLRVLMRVCGSN